MIINLKKHAKTSKIKLIRLWIKTSFMTNKLLRWLVLILFFLVVIIRPVTQKIVNELDKTINPIVSQVTISNIRYAEKGVFADFRFYKEYEYYTPVIPFNAYNKGERFTIDARNWPEVERERPISRSVGWNDSNDWFLPVDNICDVRIYVRHKEKPRLNNKGEIIPPKSDAVIETLFWSATSERYFKNPKDWEICRNQV